jgi:hypothetical protein
MVVTEVLMDASEASATLKDKLDIDIAPEVIARLADEERICHRRATTFAGAPLGPPEFTPSDLEDLARKLEANPDLTDPVPATARKRLTEIGPAGREYRPARNSFAYDGRVERDEEDAYPDAMPNSHLSRFIAEMCTTEPFPKSGRAARVRAARLHDALRQWWEIEELPASDLPARNALGRHLTRAGFPGRIQEWDNRLRENVHYRLGLRLKLKAELAADDDRQAASEPAPSQPSAKATTRKHRTPVNAEADEPRAGEATGPERLAAK